VPNYTMVFETPAARPCSSVEFSADTPVRAFILAQTHLGPAHLFADGSYVCTLQNHDAFWLIVDDSANARQFAATSNPNHFARPTRVFARLESKPDCHAGQADHRTRLPELACVD
jgi:hypothetical protein